jgi:hypothetical protein
MSMDKANRIAYSMSKSLIRKAFVKISSNYQSNIKSSQKSLPFYVSMQPQSTKSRDSMSITPKRI